MGILLVFHQSYQPVGNNRLLSAIVAGLPLYVLLVMLAVLRLPAWICALMNYSGMTSSLASTFAKTGVVFPFFAAFLGWLGVFLTGSDTSSNTLFGPLQAQTAKQLGNVISILTAGTNSSGGVMGKMISPQNLSVGAAGVNKVISGPQRKALRVRDRGCVWPRCDRPASWTSGHLLVHRIRNGPDRSA